MAISSLGLVDGGGVGAPEVGYIPTTFNTEMGKLKDWIATRLGWLDSNMPGDANGPLGLSDQKEINLRLFPNPSSELAKATFQQISPS